MRVKRTRNSHLIWKNTLFLLRKFPTFMFFSAIDDGIALLKRARSGFETTQDAERARDVVYLLAMWVVRRLLYVTMRVRFQPVSNQFFSYQINTNARVLDFYSKTSGRCQNKTYLPESLPQYLSLCKRTWKQTALKPRSWKDGSGADDALMVSLRSAETPRTLALRPIVRVAELFSLLTGCLSQWQASGSQLYSV